MLRLTVKEYTEVAFCAVVVASSMNANVPVAVGVPDSVPLGESERPGGNVPTVRLQETVPGKLVCKV